jgi:hypothetical protein
MSAVRALSPWRSSFAGCLVLATVSVAVPAVRTPILRHAGTALVADDGPGPADVVVVTADVGGGGMLEAADLVRAGLAPRVAVFTDPPDAVVDQEFLRRGVPYEDAAARSIGQLRALGVTSVEQIPRAVAGSEDEGRVLPGWFDEKGFRVVVVVSSPDHSRRLRRVMARAMRGHPARVLVHPTRYSQYDPATWWQTRLGRRTALIELQKLLLDTVRHPLS